MGRKRTQGLTDRESQIMAVLWRAGTADVEQIRSQLADPPSANTVRTLLGIMAQRGLIADDGRKYGRQYRPLVAEHEARGSALQRMINTLFAGSTEEMLVHLVDEGEVDTAQLQRLQRRIREAKAK